MLVLVFFVPIQHFFNVAPDVGVIDNFGLPIYNDESDVGVIIFNDAPDVGVIDNIELPVYVQWSAATGRISGVERPLTDKFRCGCQRTQLPSLPSA